MTTEQKIEALLEAYDRASSALRAWLESEIHEEPELVFAGEATLRVPRLEIDAGGTSVSLIDGALPWLEIGQIERFEAIARNRALALRLDVVDGKIAATLTAKTGIA